MNKLSRWTPWVGLHRTNEERIRHCRALRNLQQNPEAWGEFEFLYENLSILDSKSASLLQFNSVILAVIAIAFALSRTIAVQYFFLGVLDLSITSCLLCLVVVWVHWSTTDDLKNVEQHGLILLKVRDQRTKLYRIAWWFAVHSLFGLVVGVVLSVLTSSSR